MADKQHRYTVKVMWTGNTGTGTSTNRGDERAHEAAAEGKVTIRDIGQSVGNPGADRRRTPAPMHILAEIE